MVGTASCLSQYDILESYSVMGSEPACYLAVGEEMYLFAGTAEEQAVIMDASGGVKAGRNSLITAQAELETCDAKSY